MNIRILLFNIFGFLILFGTVKGATIYVPDDYATIQGAIDYAKDGFTIVIRPGSYEEQINFLGKAITVKGEKGLLHTTLHNGASPVVELSSGEGDKSVLEGIHVAIDYGNWVDAVYIQSSNPRITRCRLSSGPTAVGIRNIDSSPTLSELYFTACFPIINHNSSPRIINSELSGAADTIMVNYADSSPTVINSFLNGAARRAVYNVDSTPSFINCNFYSNGMAGPYYDDGSVMYNVDSTPTIVNSNIQDNIWPYFVEEGNSTTLITYSNVQGGYPGTGNIDVIAGEIYAQLGYTSPCKDAGDNSAVIVPIDFQGDPRVVDGTVDIGPDEFYTHLFIGGCTFMDGWVHKGTEVWIMSVDYPSTDPVFFIIGPGVLEDPISTPWGDWWNKWWLDFPIIGPLYIGSIPSDGINIFKAIVPNNTPVGTSIPIQGFIGNSLTNLSVLQVIG